MKNRDLVRRQAQRVAARVVVSIVGRPAALRRMAEDLERIVSLLRVRADEEDAAKPDQ